MCALMIESMPAAIAALNGGTSMARHCCSVRSIRGRPVWLSVAASPWPGKCLAVAETVFVGKSEFW